MKKKIVMIIGVGMCLALIGGCVAKQVSVPAETPTIDEGNVETPEEPIAEEDTVEPLYFDNIVFKNGIVSYEIHNENESEATFGLAFRIEKMTGRMEWVDTEVTKDLSWIEIANIISPNSGIEDAIDISPFELGTGTYRIVRTYTVGEKNQTGAVNFTVDESMTFENFEGEFIVE